MRGENRGSGYEKPGILKSESAFAVVWKLNLTKALRRHPLPEPGRHFTHLNVTDSDAFTAGGISIAGSANFNITGGKFTGNIGSTGGALYIRNATGSITGATISGNVARTTGGGIYQVSLGTVTIHSDKIFANTAPTDPDLHGAYVFV